jgi:phospholipid/cholesterol/gamma-HCH transport system substrate-binding protein
VSDYEAAQRRRDVVVGIFVITGLAALGWMVFKFGDLPAAVTRMKSFQVMVKFPTAPGVQKDTPVRFCGYQIGRVTHVMAPQVLRDESMDREYHQTMVILSIHKKYVNIPRNVQVKLMSRGLGSSYIELKVDPSKLPAPPLDPNDPASCFLRDGVIMQGSTGITSEFFPEESQEKLNALADRLHELVGHTSDILGDPDNKENIKLTLANLTDASAGVTTAMDEAARTMADARKTIEEFRVLATTGQDALKSVDAKAERLVAAIVDTSNELSKTVSRVRVTIDKINDGQGTAGRFINDGRLYEDLRETTSQLNVLLKEFKDLIDKVSEKGLGSIL